MSSPLAGAPDQAASSGPDLRALLQQERDAIVARFVHEIRRQDMSPPDASRGSLVDHVPQILDEVMDELDRLSRVTPKDDARDLSPSARAHGRQRWVMGYALDTLIREYGVLRHCILDAARTAGVRPTIDEFDMLAKCLGVGIAEATDAYVAQRDAELSAQRQRIQLLTETGELLASSLDYRQTLSRLTQMLVPRFADWCALHLEGVPESEMPIFHASDEKTRVLRELFVRFPPPAASPYDHRTVVRTGQAALLTHVDPAFYEEIAQSPEHLALNRQLGSCSSRSASTRRRSARSCSATPSRDGTTTIRTSCCSSTSRGACRSRSTTRGSTSSRRRRARGPRSRHAPRTSSSRSSRTSSARR
jgi:hypothetical protein